MTKFITVMTIFGLLALNAQAQTAPSGASRLMQHAKAINEIRLIVKDMDSIYDKSTGQVRASRDQVEKINMRTVAVINEYCVKMEAQLQHKPEVLAVKQQDREDQIKLREGLLDTTSPEARSTQANFVRGYETVKYCLGISGLVSGLIRSEISQ